jgi:hypothetical protein
LSKQSFQSGVELRLDGAQVEQDAICADAADDGYLQFAQRR